MRCSGSNASGVSKGKDCAACGGEEDRSQPGDRDRADSEGSAKQLPDSKLANTRDRQQQALDLLIPLLQEVTRPLVEEQVC